MERYPQLLSISNGEKVARSSACVIFYEHYVCIHMSVFVRRINNIMDRQNLYLKVEANKQHDQNE